MIYTVQVQIGGVLALSKSEVNAVMIEAFYNVGQTWREKYLPLHFGTNAARRYGYEQRAGERFGGTPKKGGYAARKLGFLKHNRPLEFSGDSKRRALAEEKISATRDSVVVRLPTAFNRRNPKSKVRMNDEIRTVRADERSALNKVLVREVRFGLKAAGVKKPKVSI